jgi:hypothetical protein
MNALAVIPSEVELQRMRSNGQAFKSRGVASGYCCEIPRLRFASLGMTTVAHALTLQPFKVSTSL